MNNKIIKLRIIKINQTANLFFANRRGDLIFSIPHATFQRH